MTFDEFNKYIADYYAGIQMIILIYSYQSKQG